MKKLSQEELEIALHKISTYGDRNIIMDDADKEHVLHNKSLVFMHICEHDGSNAAYQATMQAITDLENNNFMIREIGGMLIHFLSHPNYKFNEFSDAMEVIYNKFDPSSLTEPDILFEVSHDNNSNAEYVKVTIFISYYEKRLVYTNNNMPFSIS